MFCPQPSSPTHGQHKHNHSNALQFAHVGFKSISTLTVRLYAIWPRRFPIWNLVSNYFLISLLGIVMSACFFTFFCNFSLTSLIHSLLSSCWTGTPERSDQNLSISLLQSYHHKRSSNNCLSVIRIAAISVSSSSSPTILLF